MTDQEIRTFEMFLRVGVFDSQYSGYFPAGSAARDLFDEVRQAADELQGHAASQSTANGTKRQKTADKDLALKTLLALLATISRTARSMASTTPGLQDKFRLPKSRNAQVLLATARSFAAEALPLKAEFIRYALPPTFIEDLHEAIGQLETIIRDQSVAKGAQKLATASIVEVIERGLNGVRRLRPIVRNKFADQPAVLSQWESACHIQRGPRSQPDDDDNNTNQPQPPTE